MISPSSAIAAPFASNSQGAELEQIGFLVANRLLSEDECEVLTLKLSHTGIKRSRAGARHLMGVPVVAALSRDQRLLELARKELGAEPFPFSSDFV